MSSVSIIHISMLPFHNMFPIKSIITFPNAKIIHELYVYHKPIWLACKHMYAHVAFTNNWKPSNDFSNMDSFMMSGDFFWMFKKKSFFFSEKEYTPLIKIYRNSIPFSGRPCLDYPILHKRSCLFILHFHICL